MKYDKLFFDLHKELTTNPKFAAKAEHHLKLMIKASKEENQEALSHEMVTLLRLCDYNPTLIIPYLFPHFPDRYPMSMLSRPHAVSMLAMIPLGSLTSQASRQVGKCITVNSTMTVRTAKRSDSKEIMTIGQLFEEEKLAHK